MSLPSFEMAGRTIRDADGKVVPWEPWMDPCFGVTDRESADKFVREAIESATQDERDRLAKAVLGEEGFVKWKRLQSADSVVSKPIVGGPANVTGGATTESDARKAAAAAALARLSK